MSNELNTNDQHTDKSHKDTNLSIDEAQSTDIEESSSKEVSDTHKDFTPDEILTLVSNNQQLEEENTQLKDDFLRAKAETDNMKKRLIRHYEELSRENTNQLLLDIVTLLDDFDRAFEASTDTDSNKENENSIVEGIKMIENQFIQVLETKWNVNRFDSLNESFDPDKHEAMMREVSDSVDAPTVTMEFSKGYMVGDRILRTAKVKVTTPE